MCINSFFLHSKSFSRPLSFLRGNTNVERQMSHIAVWRHLGKGGFGFWHHGILCTDGTVIHFDGPGVRGGLSAKRNAQVIRSSLEEFSKSASGIYDVHYKHATFPPEEVIERAESRLGQNGYHLTENNCESFAQWCMTGKEESKQIRNYTLGLRLGSKMFGVPGAIIGLGCTALTETFVARRKKKRADEAGGTLIVDKSEDDSEGSALQGNQ